MKIFALLLLLQIPAGLRVPIPTNAPTMANLDTEKPVITAVKMGTANALLGGTFTTAPTFSITASDNIAVMSAVLLVNGVAVASVGASSGLPATFKLQYQEKTVPSGIYRFAVDISDAGGNHATAQWVMTKG